MRSLSSMFPSSYGLFSPVPESHMTESPRESARRL
uniref:Uncharacterized protein n=1 Tax=Anguilla anguilla TaxID=7936 RepID=A0A0E9VBY1_ANGAN